MKLDQATTVETFSDSVVTGAIPQQQLKEDFIQQTQQWTELGNGVFTSTGRTFKTLTAGLYQPVWLMNGVGLQVLPHNVDNLMPFKDTLGDEMIKEILDFWSQSDKFSSQGFLHRRGYMLHGPAGSGKTGIVQQIITNAIKQDGIVLFCQDPGALLESLKMFRGVESERALTCIFEDIDATIHNYGDQALLAILDGEHQANHVINIATTNYPERLDRRIVARPRRFDRVIEIGMPPLEVRYEYLAKKLQMDPAEVMMLAEDTEGLSFAALAELVISIKCLGLSADATIKRLKKMQKTTVTSANYKEEQPD